LIGGGGSKISIFFCLGGGGYETLRLRRRRLKNFSIFALLSAAAAEIF
jgi:hypothetical protein